MLGLLSIQRIQRILLLALLALMPALALAQISWIRDLPSNWSSRINEAPLGTVNLFDVHRNSSEVGTRLKLSQQSHCTGGGAMIYYLLSRGSPATDHTYFSLRDNNGTLENPSNGLTLTTPASQYATLNVKANQSLSGELTLYLKVSINGTCDEYSVFRRSDITIKLLANRDIRTAESLAAAGAFRTDSLLANSNAVTTGIVFQRGTARCPTNMTLLNHTDYLRLQHLNPTGNALTGALATAHSAVAMGGTNARALALLFKAGATVSAGTLTVSVKVDSPASNNACPGAFATTITAKLTASTGPMWRTATGDRTAATAVFDSPVSGDQPTGIRIRRNAGTCATMKVALPDNRVTGANSMSAQVRDIMRLRGINGGNNNPLSGVLGFDVTLGLAGGNYARLELRGSPPPGTLAVTAVVSSGCAAVTIEPLTLSYMVTVTSGAVWELEGRDKTSASGPFVAPALAAASTPTPTGIRVHRSSPNCRTVDVAMRSGAGNWLGLLRMRVSGGTTTAVDGAVGRSFTGAHMEDSHAQDNHFRLVFSANANVGASARVEHATVVVSPSSTCNAARSPAMPLTSTYAITIRAGYRDVGSNETLQAASTLWINNLRASATAVTTGIKFQRGLTACPNTSMRLLNHTSYLRLQPVNASDALTGSRAVSHANVPMFSGIAANNRALALLFEPQAQAPAGILTVQVLAETDTTRSGCATALANTITALVTLIDPTMWQTGSKNRNQAASVILASAIGTEPVDTGIRFHRYTGACDRARLVLTGSAATLAHFQRYTASGAKEGTAGPGIALDSLSSGVHAGLELIGTPPAGTLTFTAEATPTCSPTPPGVDPLTVSYQVTIQDASDDEQAAIGQATGAAATRVIGMRGLDSVLRRASGDLSASRPLLELLAAKEQQLESGDIDLRSFLAGQEFALGLDAAATGRPGFGVWGRAEFLQLEEGEESDPFRQEGDMFSAQLGADYRMAGGALVGLGYGRHELDTDYAGRTSDGKDYAGNYVLALDVAQPYASLPLEYGHLAGAVAIGSGEAELKDADADAGETYDADYLGWALGFRSAVNDGGLEVEGAVSGGSLDIPDLGPGGSKSDNMSMRTGMRYAPAIAMGAGSLRPSAGLALAVDWGDDPGHKYELSAGLGYAGLRLAAAAEYIYVGMNEGDLTASGGSIDVRFSTAPGNLGLGMAATPAHGATAGSHLLPDPDAGMRGSAEIGYGLAVNGGVLTPYGGWSFATEAGEVGLRLRQGDGGSWLLRWREAERDMIAIEFNLLGD